MTSNIESNELLCSVVRTSNCEVTLMLIKGGCDVNYVDKTGKSVLAHACEAIFAPQIKLLLENGAKIDSIQNLLGLVFIMMSDFEIAKLLIDNGIDPNKSDTSGTCLLHCYAVSNNITAVIWLLSRPQVKVDILNGKRRTPLRIACSNGHQLIARLLCNKGADPNIIGDDKSTPFLRSLETRLFEVTQMLLSYNIDVNIQDDKGNCALHYAVMYRKTDIIYQLAILGADKTLKNNQGKTPIDYCDTDASKILFKNNEKMMYTIPTKIVHGVTTKNIIRKFVVPKQCKKEFGQTIKVGSVGTTCHYQVWNAIFECWSEYKSVLKKIECEYIVGEKIPYHVIVVGNKHIPIRFNLIFIDTGVIIPMSDLYE